MDYEGMILAAQDAREIAEDEPDYDRLLPAGVAQRTITTRTVRIVIIVYGRSLSMEVIKRYPQIDEMISALTKTANNLDKLLEIMTTTSIKMNPDKEKDVLNEWYGTMVMNEVQKNFWTANEIGKKEDEIQDLKLENDRLKKRDDLMYSHILKIAKIYPDSEEAVIVKNLEDL